MLVLLAFRLNLTPVLWLRLLTVLHLLGKLPITSETFNTLLLPYVLFLSNTPIGRLICPLTDWLILLWLPSPFFRGKKVSILIFPCLFPSMRRISFALQIWVNKVSIFQRKKKKYRTCVIYHASRILKPKLLVISKSNHI